LAAFRQAVEGGLHHHDDEIKSSDRVFACQCKAQASTPSIAFDEGHLSRVRWRPMLGFDTF